MRINELSSSLVQKKLGHVSQVSYSVLEKSLYKFKCLDAFVQINGVNIRTGGNLNSFYHNLRNSRELRNKNIQVILNKGGIEIRSGSKLHNVTIKDKHDCFKFWYQKSKICNDPTALIKLDGDYICSTTPVKTNPRYHDRRDSVTSGVTRSSVCYGRTVCDDMERSASQDNVSDSDDTTAFLSFTGGSDADTSSIHESEFEDAIDHLVSSEDN